MAESEKYRFIRYDTDLNIYGRSTVNGALNNLLSFAQGREPCGSIEYTPSYDVRGKGAASLGYRMVDYYYQTLCDFCYSIPRSPDWIIFIRPHNRDYLVSEIGNLAKYEPSLARNVDWSFAEGTEKVSAPEAQDVIGCIFSHGVTIPGESIDVQMVGASDGKSQGFLRAPIIQSRQNLQQLQVVLKETTCSYIDFFLRPWSILVGHKGLAARPTEESLKADIVVYHLQPTDQHSKPIIRKAFQFYDAVPVTVNAEDYNYDADALIQRQVSFIYNSYSVWDGFEFNNSNAIQ